MKKQISGACRLTAKMFSAWADFHLWRGSNPRFKKALIMSAIVMLAGVLAIIGIKTNIELLIIGGGVVLFGLFVFAFSVKSAIKKQILSNAALIKDINRFCFAPTGLIVIVNHADGDERQDFFYNEIAKIYDYNGCLYCYVDRDRCFIIPIGCLDDTPEGVREFVADKLGERYIRCK